MAKSLHQAACLLSIFAFRACHKITVIISFFFLSEHVMITHPVAGEVFLRRAAIQELSLALVPAWRRHGLTEPAPGGARLGDRKADPVEEEGQSAGWHSQLLQAKLSMCRNELYSTRLEQIDRLFKCLFKPPQFLLNLQGVFWVWLVLGIKTLFYHDTVIFTINTCN